MPKESLSKSAAALAKVLQNHTASDIESSGKVIEIDSNMTPMEASQVLWENNILGAPVWDSEKKKYLGFFDMRDTLSAVIASQKDIKGDSIPLMTKWFEGMNYFLIIAHVIVLLYSSIFIVLYHIIILKT